MEKLRTLRKKFSLVALTNPQAFAEAIERLHPIYFVRIHFDMVRVFADTIIAISRNQKYLLNNDGDSVPIAPLTMSPIYGVTDLAFSHKNMVDIYASKCRDVLGITENPNNEKVIVNIPTPEMYSP